jgi:hypothetical protein
MRSKRFASGGLLGLAFMALTGLLGCGVLGEKPNLKRLLDYNPGGVGCMNQIGSNFKAYYDGTIDEATWKGTWDCATDNLMLFKRFVSASDPAGYTKEDIHGFVSGFLITNGSVTPELVVALFDLKASLFGGSREVISLTEFDRIVAILGTIKTETTSLLPHMVRRAREPSPDNLLALADALLVAGDNLSAALSTRGNPTFTFASVQALADELGGVLNISMPPDLLAWISALKVVITAGGGDGIAAGDWPRVTRAMVAYGGPALAIFSVDPRYLTGPNAMGEFVMKLAWKVKTNMLETLDLYGGALPLTSLDSVIDAMPARWLDFDRAAIKNTLRPIANKVLQSRVPNAIDSSAIDLIFEKMSLWNAGQTHLEAIFANLHAGENGVTFEEFEAEANRYRLSLPRKQHSQVYRLISLARQHRPLFLGNDNQMTFTANNNYSQHHLAIFNAITIVAQHLIKVYSTMPGGTLGTADNLQAVVTDFTDIARALRAADLSVPGWATARFLEGNLFTFASNGDKFIDTGEATELIALGFSSAPLSKKVREGTDRVCPSLGKDVLGNNWKAADCFRREFFGNNAIYWDHLPLLVQYYRHLSESDKVKLQNAMEKAARRYGVSEQPIASNDQDGYAGIMQYVETLLARFDFDNSQTFNLSEAMAAYPVFKGPLAEFGGVTGYPNFIIETIFTYVIKYGHPPAKNWKGYAHLVAWGAQKPLWGERINSDRLKLYQVIESLAQPQPLPGGTPVDPAENEPTLGEVLTAHGILSVGTGFQMPFIQGF